MSRNGLQTTRRALLRGGVGCSLGVLAGCIANSEQHGRSGAPTGDAVRWSSELGDSIRHRPAVGDGVAYVAGGTNDRATSPGEQTSPARSENVSAFAVTDGSRRWRYEAPAGVTAPPIVSGGGVYSMVGWRVPMSGRDWRLVRIDGGSRTWSTDPDDTWLSVLAVDESAAYLGTYDDASGESGERLSAVRTSDGRERWSVEAGDVRTATLRDHGFYAVEGGRTVARKRSDGSVRWYRETSPAGDLRAFDGTLFLEGAQTDAGNHPLLAVDAADGSERWRFSAPVDEPFAPTGAVASSDLVFATEYDGHLFGLDAEDGTERWAFATDRDLTRAAVSGSRAVVGTEDGFVLALGEA